MTYHLDVQFIQPFIDGTLETLRVQCNLTANAGPPHMKGAPGKPGLEVEITGIVGLTSDAFNGSISICFPKETFLAVMGQMLGEQYTEITNDLADGAGELTNIIFGYAKRVLNEKGYTLKKALPSVVRGQKLKVQHLTPVPILVLPFQTDKGPFNIEIAVEPLAKVA